MNSKPVLALSLALCGAAWWPLAARAQAAADAPAGAGAAPAPATAASAAARLLQVEDRVDRKEPNVQHTVIEDGGSRIDELVVRGQVQHVVVTPKVGLTKSYEIIVGGGGRQQLDGTGGATGAIGKRVWNVFAF